ncbi:peptidoglycan-binding protein [uncultured Microbacterium sp.]|uniref:peptidoglycan-binding domain-containing protein n=1 Tax=uncultured Microbacterium sp. TaxID=191216 RepID=UPI0026031C93|nr:peptidoglycan-binding domain-containing protein [uncultured Microbacterium sp.]
MNGSHAKRIGPAVGWFLAGTALTGALAWSMLAVVRPPDDPTSAAKFTLVEVVAGEVGSTVRLNTVAAWTTSPVGTNRAVGVVTSIGAEAGAEVSQGSALYSVDLHPVVIARGVVPSFRDISEGSKGEDVRQIQQLLADLGFYRGEVGGEAGTVTAAAIRAWQKSLNVEVTGTVRSGDVIFVPTLPARVALNIEEIYRGASLVGGESAVSGLSPSPAFNVPVTDSQASLMPAGTRVLITSPNGSVWDAVAEEQVRDEVAGSITVKLGSGGQDPICKQECAQIPVDDSITLSSEVVTVETVTGLVVPSAALVSAADGQLAVIDEAGIRRSATVMGTARGMAVIDGVDAGVRVRVPGEATG